MKKSKGMKLGAMLAAVLLVSVAFVVVVNAQGQDIGRKALGNENPALYDAQIYASNNNINTEEALRRFQLQDIAGKLDAELTNETETFAGLWVEHKPKFKIVVQFTRNGEETIKPYLKQYAELADIVEVRTVKESLANLQREQAIASNSARALGISVESDINVYNNSVELYMTKSDRSRFDDALLRKEGRLSDKVKVIPVETKTMGIPEADIYGGLSLSDCTSGFSVQKGFWIFITKGITTAGHCSDAQSYNGDLSSGGDSGGPWFLTGDAYGTHHGAPTADPNDAIYMAVDYVSGLGVSVMTSP